MNVKYIGRNFKEPISCGTIEISQNENDKYSLGVLPKGIKATLFENPQYSWVEDMTIAELNDFKKAMISLIERVEKAAEVEKDTEK